jgi:phosphonoacetate hydrolase
MLPTGAGIGQSVRWGPISLAAVSVTASPAWLSPQHQEAADAAMRVLTDGALDRVVDMVLSASDGIYEARSREGAVRFRRAEDGTVEVVATEGRDPLRDQAPDRFAPLAAELAHRYPERSQNAYPHAFDQVAQLFDHPAAPDLCVVHAAAHNWEDQGGHRGEHGSLGVVQARAPFILSGTGVRQDGLVARSARLVDVAPTILELLGVEAGADGLHLTGQDGEVRRDALDARGARPGHVVAFLFDGANANVLYDMATRGEAPNVARLIESGIAYGHGAMAGLPTVTLANHTSIMTGRLPGHHGVLHNAWFDRRTGEQVITNSSATWPWCMQHLFPGVESVHSVLRRTRPATFTASVDEPCDHGASWSTFDAFRRGEVPTPGAKEALPHTTERFVRPNKDYRWSTIIDHAGVEQAVGILGGRFREETFPMPTFLFCNFTLTDAAMHAGGPHSEIAAASVRDTDARMGEVLAAVEAAGIFDDTAFVLVADHGMEENDPTATGDWGVALSDAGLQFRDEGYGFLYFGES